MDAAVRTTDTIIVFSKTPPTKINVRRGDKESCVDLIQMIRGERHVRGSGLEYGALVARSLELASRRLEQLACNFASCCSALALGSKEMGRE
jgi:hypothetical protein